MYMYMSLQGRLHTPVGALPAVSALSPSSASLPPLSSWLPPSPAPSPAAVELCAAPHAGSGGLQPGKEGREGGREGGKEERAKRGKKGREIRDWRRSEICVLGDVEKGCVVRS